MFLLFADAYEAASPTAHGRVMSEDVDADDKLMQEAEHTPSRRQSNGERNTASFRI